MRTFIPFASLLLTLSLIGKVVYDGKMSVDPDEEGTTFDYSYYRWARKMAGATGPENRDIAYGDFDGDGKIDSARPVNGELTLFFGGDQKPRPLSSFKIISLEESEKIFTDNDVQKIFEQEGETWPFVVDEFHGPMEKNYYGTRPGRPFWAKNGFQLRHRSGLFMHFAHVMIFEVYIFERTRKKVIIDHDSRG